MFTGLVRDIGSVMAVRRGEGLVSMDIHSSRLKTSVGESVAASGVCLTAVLCDGDRFAVEIMPETLAHTTLRELRPGSKVNLEPAVRLGEGLDGHLVTGHVDGVGTVRGIVSEGMARRMEIELPAALARYVARKGSVAVDGTSLTVAAVTEHGFEVALIPHTILQTTLSGLLPGAKVNVEVDIVARYLERLMAFAAQDHQQDGVRGGAGPAAGRGVLRSF